jgi:hypothetical protein
MKMKKILIIGVLVIFSLAFFLPKVFAVMNQDPGGDGGGTTPPNPGGDGGGTTPLTMTGTLTPASSTCTITSGSSCTQTLSWGIEHPKGTPTAITASGMSDINVTNTLASPQSGTQSVTVPYSSRIFYFYNNGIKLAETTVTAVPGCTSPTVWNGSSCATPPVCIINSFTADNPTPPYNTGTNLRFSLSGSFPWQIDFMYMFGWGAVSSGTGSSSVYPTGNLSTGSYDYRLTCGSVNKELTIAPTYNPGTLKFSGNYDSLGRRIARNSDTWTMSVTGGSANMNGYDHKITNSVTTDSITGWIHTNPSGDATVGYQGYPSTVPWTCDSTNNKTSIDTIYWDNGMNTNTTTFICDTTAPVVTINPASGPNNLYGTADDGWGTGFDGVNYNAWTNVIGVFKDLTTNMYSCGSSGYTSASLCNRYGNNVGTGNHVDWTFGSIGNGPPPVSATTCGHNYQWTVSINDEIPLTGSQTFDFTPNKPGVNCTGGTMSGTLSASPTSCTIASGGSSCNVNLTWTTTNPEVVGGSKVTSSYPAANTTVYSGDAGSSKSVTIPYNSRTFYLYNNNKSLVPTSESPNGSGATVTATCERAAGPGPSGGSTVNTHWDSTSLKCVPDIVPSCSAPLTQNVTVACDLHSGVAATSGSVIRSQTKNAYPDCTFPTPVTGSNSTYVSDNCVYPLNGGWTAWTPAQSTQCGYTGTQTRTCTNPTPANGGADCSSLDGGNSSRTYTTPACTISLPDLTASAVTPTSAFVNTSTTFSATISNIGNASTGKSFSNFFQVTDSTHDKTNPIDLTATTMSTLSAGATNTTTKSHTFSTVGTYSMRACADLPPQPYGVIDEGTTGGETNNCGPWTDVTVTGSIIGACGPTLTNPTHYNCSAGTYAGDGVSNTSNWTWTCNGLNNGAPSPQCSENKVPPSCTNISATDCGIPGGESTCDTILNWGTQNLTSGVTAVTRNNPDSHIAPPILPTTSGTNVRNTVNYGLTGQSTFFVYHNIDGTPTKLCQVTMTARCDLGGSWDGSICNPLIGLSGTLNPTVRTNTSCDIKENESSCKINFTWNTIGAVETVSKVTSAITDTGTEVAGTVVATGNSGSKDFAIPYNIRTFYLYNANPVIPLATSIVTSKCSTSPINTTWDSIKNKCVKVLIDTCQNGTSRNYMGSLPCLCPTNYTGTYPNCTPPPGGCVGNCGGGPGGPGGGCPTGYTGTYPSCTGPVGGICPMSYIGTYPDCIGPDGAGPCPTGYTPNPAYPRCTGPAGGICPTGYTGTYPSCTNQIKPTFKEN